MTLSDLLARERLKATGDWDTDMAKLLEHYAKHAAREILTYRDDSPLKREPAPTFNKDRHMVAAPPKQTRPTFVQQTAKELSSDYHAFD